MFTLAELLQKFAPDWKPPAVDAKALVQTHCHQHAVMRFDADAVLMRSAGIDIRIPDSGCCGLAGNFGFEWAHYQVSEAAGERVLLPAVRAADSSTLIISDGFSCRTQIAQGTRRTPAHLAEVLVAALPAARERQNKRLTGSPCLFILAGAVELMALVSISLHNDRGTAPLFGWPTAVYTAVAMAAVIVGGLWNSQALGPPAGPPSYPGTKLALRS